MNSYKIRHLKRPKIVIFSKRRIFFLVLFTILLGGVSYFFFFSDYFSIKTIVINGNKKIASEDVRKIADNQFSKKSYFIFPQKNIILANSSRMLKSIEDSFPIFEKIQIKRTFPATYAIILEEREPVACWCKESCFNVDETGFAFENGEECPVKVFIPQDPELKKRIGDAYLFSNIVEILKETKGKLDIKEILFGNDGYKITAKEGEGYEIYFENGDNVKEEIIDLLAVLNEEIPKEKRANLLYIDLRFGNKVFYKFK